MACDKKRGALQGRIAVGGLCTGGGGFARAFAGGYRSSEIESSYVVIATESGLLMRRSGASEARLKPFEKDTFIGPGGVLKFFRNSRGRVAGFTMNRYDVRGLRFARLRAAD
jgi:hypothetical protein